MADLNIGNSSASVVVNAKHNGSVIPQINNTYDLGTSTLKWKNIYGDLKGNALTVGQGNSPDTYQDANDLILNAQSKLTFYSFNSNRLANRPSGSNWGYLTVGGYDGKYNYQTFIDGDNGNTWNRILYNGTWRAWKKFLDSSNYTSYTVTKTGSGASGTWGISISGNAATATKLATARTISLDTGVTSTARSFDGSGNITIPVNSIKESYLAWGGKNFNGDYGCIDAAMVSDLGANRLMFGKAAGITIQYSTDGGNNWINYGASDSEKVGLFSSGCGFNIGKATKDTITANCMLRVIINTDNFNVYTILNKFVIYLSTNGCSGCYCTIDASLESSPTTFTTFANKVPVSGWSGYNVINTSSIITYGNSPSTQYGLIRFTFGCTSVNTNYPGLSIIQIMGFGGVGWVTPSTMAKTGHLYSYDRNQNAAFPATVTAPTFRGALSGNASTATKAAQDSAGQQINTTYIKGLSISGRTITYTKGDGTTGTITTQDTNTTYGNATTSAAGLMSKDDKAKLDGITASADAVSFSRSLTSGTKIGTITINGTGTDLYAPTNTDTHWTTGLKVGASNTATANAAASNGSVYLNVLDNSTIRDSHKIVGSGATSVTSDANGVITISSTDNNTTYGSMSVSEGTTGTATTNRVLTAANLKGIINAHAPTKTGGGASGTWGISISGNAATASKVNNKLTVGSKSYDGSAAVTIAASDLGLSSAMLFLGTTTTAITDGATTNPVAIGGSNKTVTSGNVVLYGSKEFVWTGSAWEELGNEGSYKIVQAAVADPSASGTSNTFIATISQDANGKITATKETVAVTNSAPTLAWGATSTIGTVAGTNLQVKMPANPNTDTKVTQTAINSADYTNWRPLIWGSSNSGTEGFTPSTVTDGVFTAQTLSCQPATGTIRATTFKGSLSGNAATATKLATARTISLTGSITGSGTFDGSGNLSITTTTNHNHDGNYVLKSGDTMTGNLTVPTVIGNLSGNAATMSYPLGFSNRNNDNWINGDFTYDGFTTYITDWDEPSGGSIYWASNSKGQLAAGIDGYFYQGRDTRDKKLHRCLDTYDLANDTFNRANYANYLSNASHNITISRSDWGASNPWGCTHRTLVWGQRGYNGSYSPDTADIVLYYGNTGASGGAGWFLHIDGGIYSMGGIYGAVWNDYAEFRESTDEQPGRVVMEDGKGVCQRTNERLQPFAGIISDTFGFSEGKTDKATTPLAVAGRVLAYPYQNRNNYKPGDCVCAAPNGTVDIMTREEVREWPDRIVGTVSEIPSYETWGTGNVKVDGRIWIKVK